MARIICWWNAFWQCGSLLTQMIPSGQSHFSFSIDAPAASRGDVRPRVPQVSDGRVWMWKFTDSNVIIWTSYIDKESWMDTYWWQTPTQDAAILQEECGSPDGNICVSKLTHCQKALHIMHANYQVNISKAVVVPRPRVPQATGGRGWSTTDDSNTCGSKDHWFMPM